MNIMSQENGNNGVSPNFNGCTTTENKICMTGF